MSFNTTTKAIQLISKNVNQYLNHFINRLFLYRLKKN
jgi:hypothetical protein